MSATYTRSDVAKHNTRDDCWVIYDNRVFNVTEFLADHPGGEDVVLGYAGKDVGAIMKDKDMHVHSRSAYGMLEDFVIGKLAASDVDTSSKNGLPSPFLAENERIADDFEPEETDMSKDFAHYQFLDLTKPLIPQMWNASFTKEFYLEQVHIPRHCREPAQLMPFQFLEVFTKTPWYVIPMLWLPIAAAFLHVSAMQFRELFANSALQSIEGYAAALACWAFGVLFWTFIEYLFHRFLFHMDSLLPRHQFFYLMHFLLHGIHHFLPMDRYRLVMPPVLFAVLSFPMLLLAHAVLPPAVANGVISGSYSMYVVYDTMHYALHHTQLPEYVREQKRYHLEHHYKNYELGFGVTSKLWDYVFHTVL